VTGEVSQAYPKICPRCSRPIVTVQTHFRNVHPGMTGRATLKANTEQSFEFALIAPEQSSGRWLVALYDWPFEIVPIRPDLYAVEWNGGRA